MQKTFTKMLILAVVLTTALGVNYLFASWTGPTQDPTGGNTDAPIHVGVTDQVKSGGLSVDALSVFGGGYFQGNVGVGVVTPTQSLDVSGKIKIGNDSTSPDAGTIRFTGSDFEGFNGTSWVSMTGGSAPAAPLASADCDAASGSWEGGQSICYFSGTSCPSGWSPSANYSSTNSGLCTASGSDSGRNGGNTGWVCGGSSCLTSSHSRTDTGIETCSYIQNYYKSGFGRGGGNTRCATSTNQTCTATQTEVGCTKN